MRACLISGLIAIAIPLGVAADPVEDATVIVSLTVTDDVLASSMEMVAGMLVGTMQNEFSKRGQKLSDNGAIILSGMMLESMIVEMKEGMHPQLIDAYIDTHSVETLSAYRAFLESPAGQEVIKLTPTMMREGNVIGENIGGQIGQVVLEKVRSDMKEDKWPDETSVTTRRELKALFGME